MLEPKPQTLNILLLKNDYTTAQDAIKKGSSLRPIDIKYRDNLIGKLYIKSSQPKPPRWFSFFEDTLDRRDIGTVKNVSAVLLVEASNRLFAVTFGHGRFLLEPDSWIDRFGLKVALNSIGKDKIRTVDKSSFDAINRQSKEQASKETDVRDFGLDVEQDLLRAVTGIPKHPSMGKRLYGMDALNISIDISIDKLPELLGRVYDKSLKDTYKTDFPWVDHICGIKDKSTISKLDNVLIDKISSQDIDKIWMAVPEIIDWDQVRGFCYEMHERSPEYEDIHLPHFAETHATDQQPNISKETLTKKYVNCIHNDGHRIYRWQGYKCLYAEISIERRSYLLSHGKWYEVDVDFVESVNTAFSKIPNFQDSLPIYNTDSEGKYNKTVANESNGKYALMDQVNIPYGGGHSKIEFCDLYSKNHDIIHVKRYGASSVLSHLFAQGRISGELFQMEANFRKEVTNKLPDELHIQNTDERPPNDLYQIVYAIISDIDGELELPFFSKLNLKNSDRSLRGLGYRVAKYKIDVHDRIRRKTIYKKKRKTA